MKIKLSLIVSFFIFYLGFSCTSNKFRQPGATVEIKNACPPETKPFPSYDAKFAPSEQWCRDNPSARIFQLSQNFDQAEKVTGEALPWKKYASETADFKTNWKKYLFAVLRYAYEGNIEKDWFVQENERRRWFHAPWMHASKTGREFLRGLTQERGSCLKELTLGKICETDESRPIQNWAVSVYNEAGGYYFKQVWQEMYNKEFDASRPNPNPNPKNFGDEGFPEGTVAVKLLFTAGELDYLKKSVTWEADINRGQAPPQKMRLLQIDVAVKDKISPTGWVFGTFIYHDDAPEMEYSDNLAEDKRVWLKMIPVGLMFGNDVGEFPEIKEPFETFLNDAIPVRQHYGCRNRLNGPVDNARSSCVSCHALAEAAQDFKPISFQEKMNCASEEDVKFWFKNINPASRSESEKTFSKSTPDRKIYSLDYSLQLQKGIERCCEANVCKCAPPSATPQKPHEITKDGVF
ncbi:MAG TPA: hypothetical protein VGC76_09630 [Pyrinomonadaceae bacterium]|jgi:hypothetical protein